jgi:S1-C subfamily serine protease
MPVFNHQAELIGVTEGMIQGVEHLSLILPASTCKKVMQAMEGNEGKISRGWIGVFVGRACPLGTVGKGVEKDEILPNMVAQLVKDGFAQQAGLQAGDLILSCGGQKIDNAKDLRRVISSQTPGSRVRMNVLQRGEEVEKVVEVGEAPPQKSLRRCASRSI